MSIKFDRRFDAVICGKIVESKHGPAICMRVSVHDGHCIPMARAAAKADGVCHTCRQPFGEYHRKDCESDLRDRSAIVLHGEEWDDDNR